MIEYWLGGSNIELAWIDNELYALYGWNGEKYVRCWKCHNKYTAVDDGVEYEIKPIYDDEDFIIGYEIV